MQSAGSRSKTLNYFPRHLEPREVQRDTLIELGKQWNTADIFVVNLPVASGKSAIAITIAHWQKKASIIVPNKLLVNQYKDEYTHIHVLRAKADYYCEIFNCSLDKRPFSKKIGKLCKKDTGCIGCETYRKDLRKSRVMPYLLSNYYIYLSHRLYRDTLIIDEAHNLIDMIKGRNSKKFWQHKYRFPDNLYNREKIKEWINNRPPEVFDDSLLKLKYELNNKRPIYHVYLAEDKYHNEVNLCIKMVPLDVSTCPPLMWPSSVKKIILLSATISRKDIEQLGLANKSIKYINSDSPISKERRPVIIPAEHKSMAFHSQEQNLRYLVDFINKTATDNPDSKGLIHVTYSLASKLKKQEYLSDVRDRLIFHSKQDKSDRYNQFRKSTEPKILVASGMYEGIDLPYDSGRWQIIAKVPWPSLADPAIRYLSELDDEWYAWETIKSVLQASGRICRTPTDYGETFIFDSTFLKLYSKNKDLFPEWFKNSIQKKE